MWKLSLIRLVSGISVLFHNNSRIEEKQLDLFRHPIWDVLQHQPVELANARFQS